MTLGLGQVVGVSGGAWQALAAWRTQNNIKHLQPSDIRCQMLPAFDAMITDEKTRCSGTPGGPTSSSTATAW